MPAPTAPAPSGAPPAEDGPPAVELRGVRKRFGAVEAVRDASLAVRPGEFFSFLGPSGCGKTTLLRIVAGFERPDAGSVRFDGRDATAAPPQARPTAMVFQSYALFPTMTVAENVAYGLRVRGVDRKERARQVDEALGRVDLAGLGPKPVTQLSGGQQQRVALARALAVAPRVLLFDEPLSNLDVALRESTRRELKTLQQSLGTTSLYVTHDQQEALALSDRVAVMRDGRVVQVAPPETLYAEPETAFVAGFLGYNVVRDAALAARLAGEAPPEGTALAVRPEHLRLVESGVPAGLRARQFLGTVVEWWVEADGRSLRVHTPPDAAPPDAGGTLHLAAARYRWVRDDLAPNTEPSGD